MKSDGIVKLSQRGLSEEELKNLIGQVVTYGIGSDGQDGKPAGRVIGVTVEREPEWIEIIIRFDDPAFAAKWTEMPPHTMSVIVGVDGAA